MSMEKGGVGLPTSTAPFFKQLAKLLASNLLTRP